jgi:hypothetical protein
MVDLDHTTRTPCLATGLATILCLTQTTRSALTWKRAMAQHPAATEIMAQHVYQVLSVTTRLGCEMMAALLASIWLDVMTKHIEAQPVRGTVVCSWIHQFTLAKSIKASNTVPDIVYNTTSGLWSCCGADARGVVDCLHPLDGAFQGASPQSLIGTAYTAPTVTAAPSGGSSSSDSRSTPATISSGTTASQSTTDSSVSNESNSAASPTSVATDSTASSEPSDSPDLSYGAKIAVPIICVVAAFALVWLAYYCLRKRRLRKRHTVDATGTPATGSNTAPVEGKMARDYYEALGDSAYRVEKDSQTVQELSADPIQPHGAQSGPDGGSKLSDNQATTS